MKKGKLQDIKRRNRQIIVQAVLESGGLSRIEIAQKTELSPSTVSALVGELLAEDVLAESGVRVVTAGRSRTELTVNKDYGGIIVVEVGRRGVWMTQFDLCLNLVKTATLASRYTTGNELFSLICKAVADSFGERGRLSGIGLLFQEDMRASDFHVVYSTSLSSASISLRESLVTQFRVPVEEEYTQTYTVTNALTDEPEERNRAHIVVGAHVAASVTVAGQVLPLRENFYGPVSALLDGSEETEDPDGMARRVGTIIALLCTMFPLDVVLLSGMAGREERFFQVAVAQARERMGRQKPPVIERVRPRRSEQVAALFAARLRDQALFQS